MKLSFKAFFLNIYIFLLISVFLIGGSIQFFFGVATTLYSLGLLVLIFSVILLYTLIYFKIFVKRTFTLCFVYIFLVFLNGIINDSGIAKTLLYCIFPLTPFGVFYLYEIIEKKNFNINRSTVFFFKIIAVLQLPIALIQNVGYDFLIQFNHSNQEINEYDFMFGSFFIRADHALGFFLLINILYYFGIQIKGEKKPARWGMILYLSLTVFVLESNLTKIILILFFLYYLFLWLYKKLSVIAFFVILLVSVIILNLVLFIPKIYAQYYYIMNRYTAADSEILVNQGFNYAKRPHIMIDFIVNKPVKWLGEGPYDYFNIFSGEFKNTYHFSQLIWTYNDLGLIGLIVVILLLYQIIKSLKLQKREFVILFISGLFFLFMTNMYSDLAMMLSLVLLKTGYNLTNQQKTN